MSILIDEKLKLISRALNKPSLSEPYSKYSLLEILFSDFKFIRKLSKAHWIKLRSGSWIKLTKDEMRLVREVYGESAYFYCIKEENYSND